jgi:hypothetical protein
MSRPCTIDLFLRILTKVSFRHAWDLSRYGRQLSSQSAADEQYKVPDYYQDKDACLTSLAMSVVQDNYFTMDNVAAIRKLPLRCRFININNQDRRGITEYFVVISNQELVSIALFRV